MEKQKTKNHQIENYWQKTQLDDKPGGKGTKMIEKGKGTKNDGKTTKKYAPYRELLAKNTT